MIDAFGIGYSSLRYLDRFPIDSLKIDRSFIANLHTRSESQEIVRIAGELDFNEDELKALRRDLRDSAS